MKREELMSIKEIGNKDIKASKLYNFLMFNNLYDSCDIATAKEVCDTIFKEAAEENLVSIGILISGITEWAANYFMVDGYGNYSDLTSSHMDDVINDILASENFEDDEEGWED